ncbi:DUF4270 family protein [Aureibacter tunicatorum]|uniref:DUF4270 family protein n=1 Tax=Aureibacter tunicatorum TaxID=866807 RepID=A0AAE4BRU2_9BACT|nr:DUF4270 family protein [Aureibacter tunicatorum]MDR6240549.1 hypothetical protein [Aureibacter tunicatorum]BDD06590.1 hypothetical protein AUTU_40730 [Aureibacter tunicatorum]
MRNTFEENLNGGKEMRLYIGGILLFITMIAGGCHQSDESFSFVDDDYKDGWEAVFIDTVTVEVGTVWYDNVSTQGGTNLVLGSVNDNEFGDVKAMSFIQMAAPKNLPTLDEEVDVVYDSMVMYMKFNGYYYGDTLAPIQFKSNALSSRIHVDDVSSDEKEPRSYFISSDSIPIYEDSELFNVNVQPRPGRMDTLKIRFNREFEENFFTYLKSRENSQIDEEKFLQYIHGIRMSAHRSNQDQKGVALGFQYGNSSGDPNAPSMPSFVKIYYHKRNDFDEVTYSVDFPIGPEDKRFNHYSSNWTDTELDFIKESEKAYPSTTTDNFTYIQDGTGLMLRLDIPHLGNLSQLGNDYMFSNAHLIMEPYVDIYDTEHFVPSTLGLYWSDYSNAIKGEVIDPVTQVPYTATYFHDKFDGEKMYSFDITPFIDVVLRTDPYQQLNFMIRSTSTSTGINRVKLGDMKDKKIYLRLIYLRNKNKVGYE